MTSIESQPPPQCGKLVALEGDIDTVATQLRLLPSSQKILVLPSLLDGLPQEANPQQFDPRTLIQDVYKAFAERTEQARAFLLSSTDTQPRLVFMNGGSVSARWTCITKICENMTNGDVRVAELIFNEIIKDGVAGLMKQDEPAVEAADEELDTNDEDVAEEDLREAHEIKDEAPERTEEPSVKAMKVADCLDSKTAELQENVLHEKPVGTDEGPSSGCPEAESEVTNVKDDSSTSVTGDDIVRTVLTLPTRPEHASGNSAFGSRYPDSVSTPFTAATNYTEALSHQADDDHDYDSEYDYNQDLVSPGNDSSCSIPPTPRVVYGEACVVDVQFASPKKTVRNVKSFDRYYPSNWGYADWSPGSTGAIKHSKSAYHLGRPATSSGRMQEDQHYYGFQTLPRTTFLKASKTTIRKSPSISESRASFTSTPKSKIHIYVDRGTDADEIVIEEEPEEQEPSPFEPVFAVVEDLIIHFAHDTPNDIFEHVISGYENGSYPILPPAVEPDSLSIESSSMSENDEEKTIRPTSLLMAETDDDGFHRRHEFDPYADNNYPGGVHQWPLKHERSQRESAGRNLEPPTPSLTPPPTARGITEKFCKFSPMNPNSVIGIQNSLRKLLNLHFPVGESGYTQYCFPVSPETDRLWKPVFRNDDTSSIGNEDRKSVV